MIRLSILIPVYNAEKYIGSLLDCILQQINDSVEVILLNDGSQDSSEIICSEYAANFPNLIRFISRTNKGAVLTRRELFCAAFGEWIWIIDSDDMLLTDSIPKIMKIITANSDYDMIMFDYYLNSEENETIVHQLLYENGMAFYGEDKKVLYKQIICGPKLNQLWNKVFKMNCIDFEADYSEYEDVRKANDCLQVIPILTNAQSIRYESVPIYIYNTMNQESLSHAFQDYTYTSLKKVWKRKKEYIYKWNMWDSLQMNYYLQGSSVAFDLLKKKACSKIKYKEYACFFDKLMSDGVFSEAIENADIKEIPRFDKKILFISIKNKHKRISYLLVHCINLIGKVKK